MLVNYSAPVPRDSPRTIADRRLKAVVIPGNRQGWDGRGNVTRPRRMVKKVVQRGRSEREADAYSFRYVEALSDARTKLADFFNILPKGTEHGRTKQRQPR